MRCYYSMQNEKLCVYLKQFIKDKEEKKRYSAREVENNEKE